MDPRRMGIDVAIWWTGEGDKESWRYEVLVDGHTSSRGKADTRADAIDTVVECLIALKRHGK